jgi:hypothetical protein
MPAFKTIDLADFIAEVAAIRFDPVLEHGYQRLDQSMIFGFSDDALCMVHEGTLVHTGQFKAPAYHVLIKGDLIVDGVIDTSFAGADEGGSFFVTGNVICNAYINHWGKAEIIGGDLQAHDFLHNAFSDSLLYVGGSIKTRFFYGHDMWAEFGGHAEIKYGIGYCLPLGYQDAPTEAVKPFFNEEESARAVVIDDIANRDSWDIAELVRKGEPVFRD